MITILPADEAFLQQIAAPAGVDAMVLRERNEITGHVLFSITDGERPGDTLQILRVECDEPLMVDALIRSALNTGDCRGAVYGECRLAALEATLRRLEFRPNGEGVWRVVIAEFFALPCRGEK